jgi:hypothetical protein
LISDNIKPPLYLQPMHGKGRRHTDKDIMVMYDAAKHDPAEYAPVNISFDFEML